MNDLFFLEPHRVYCLLSIGKNATAHFIDTAAQMYGLEGYKWDESRFGVDSL